MRQAGRLRHRFQESHSGSRVIPNDVMNREMHLRHASFYQEVLSTANDLYANGGADQQRSHELLDAEWENVQAG
jgi:hypothetical protein